MSRKGYLKESEATNRSADREAPRVLREDRHPFQMARPRRHWIAEEDMILRQEVKKAQAASNTTVSWNEIATSLPGRTNKDCRKRWHGTASAKVNKGPWAEDEDERLRMLPRNTGPSGQPWLQSWAVDCQISVPSDGVMLSSRRLTTVHGLYTRTSYC
ncbi:hypothetical protein BDV10DRAFT_172520 [Aspergillus recurvatus]